MAIEEQPRWDYAGCGLPVAQHTSDDSPVMSTYDDYRHLGGPFACQRSLKQGLVVLAQFHNRVILNQADIARLTGYQHCLARRSLVILTACGYLTCAPDGSYRLAGAPNVVQVRRNDRPTPGTST